MLCTQPRRISAIGVAERVASERAERVGQTVGTVDTCTRAPHAGAHRVWCVTGYQIRLESRRSRATRLLFCTTGVLLRRLQCDRELAGVSHIFVDEVHERDLNTDFLLIILRRMLQTRSDVKLVLMSATLNAVRRMATRCDAVCARLLTTAPKPKHTLRKCLRSTLEGARSWRFLGEPFLCKTTTWKMQLSTAAMRYECVCNMHKFVATNPQ